MTIGVDAGALSIADDRLKVGVYRVVYNLLKELSEIDHINTYKLYSFAPISPEILREFGDKMENVVLTPARGWFSVRLPFELRIHPVDVFLGLSQAMPRISSPRLIGFVYDVSFSFNPRAYPDSGLRLHAQTNYLTKSAHKIITISHATAKDLGDIYPVAKNKISVHYPGVDKLFSSKGAVYKHDLPYVLFVGSLNRTKNIPLALRAFKEFLEKSKRSVDFLLIGGEFWSDPAIDETIQSLKLEHRVHKLGFVKDDILPHYYRGAELFIATSYREGFCLPAAEALACGTPVVAVQSGALSEVVGRGGIVTESVSGDLAYAMAELLTNSDLRKKLSKEAVKQSKQYSWSQFAQGIYYELIDHAHTRN